MLDSAVLAALVAAIAALIGSAINYRRVRNELQRLENEKQTLEVELSAERAAKRLLECTRWRRRTFKALQYHFGGYTEDELRKLLVRAGALRFHDDVETWGLLDRNKDELEKEMFTKDF